MRSEKGRKRSMKQILSGALAVLLALCLAACGARAEAPAPAEKESEAQTAEVETREEREPAPEETEDESMPFQMKINDTAVAVDWEENESVEALAALCREEPLTIQMSMYGGFEQVGPIGASLPRSDKQTTTDAGDIVLYAGNQIVVFYGSNDWAYTRLGHISDQSAADMAALLGHGDVTLTLTVEGGR